MRTRLTFQELEKFIDVAATLSFRASAERLCISQPALSRTIASAEAKLGARLFDRDTHGVTLTRAGQQLLPMAQRIVFELNDSLSELSEFVAGHRGQVLIASIPSAAAAILPGPMQAFLRDHPGVSIDLQSLSSAEVCARVADGTVDIGVCACAPGACGAPDGCDFIPLIEDELMLICSKNEALARRRSASWKVFATRPYIANGQASSLRPMVQQAFAQAGVTVHAQYESMNLPVTARMVAAGLGMAVLSSLSRDMINSAGLAFLRLENPRVSRRIGVLVRRRHSLSEPARRFLEHLLACGRSAAAAPGQPGDAVALSR
jgi:LysR family carnitine catabolism transcriptional activator